MASRVTPYPTPPAIRSSLVKNPSDTVPPIEDLEALQAELRLFKQRTLERAKKAGEDLITLQESFKRIKERKKGKGKAIEKEKVKKERGCAYFLSVARNSCSSMRRSGCISLARVIVAVSSHSAPKRRGKETRSTAAAAFAKVSATFRRHKCGTVTRVVTAS